MAAVGMVSFVVVEMAPMNSSVKEMDFGGGRSHDDFGNDNNQFSNVGPMKERNWRKKKLISPKVRETSHLPNYEIKMSMVVLVVAYLQQEQEVVCVARMVYIGVCRSHQGSLLVIFDH